MRNLILQLFPHLPFFNLEVIQILKNERKIKPNKLYEFRVNLHMSKARLVSLQWPLTFITFNNLFNLLNTNYKASNYELFFNLGIP